MNRVCHVGEVATPLMIENPQPHDGCAVRQSGDTIVIVGALRDGTSDMGPMTMLIIGILVVIDEIVANDSLGLFEIGDEDSSFASLYRFLERDAGVDHSNDDPLSSGQAPRVFGTHLIEVPLKHVEWIVYRLERFDKTIDLGMFDSIEPAQGSQQRLDIMD